MHRIYPSFLGGPGAVGLLLVRLVTGAAFMHHGWGKIQNPLHWMDKMPEPAPPVLQALAAFSEFGGGIALILGLLTPLAALGIACTMITAIVRVHLPHGDPFVNPNPEGHSYELAAAYLASVIMLMLVGPGLFSLDAMFFRKKPSAPPGQ